MRANDDRNRRLIVSAPGLKTKELKSLRKQLDKSFCDPDYVILTNYPVEIVEFVINGSVDVRSMRVGSTNKNRKRRG